MRETIPLYSRKVTQEPQRIDRTTREDAMKRLILILALGTIACGTLFAFQTGEQHLFSQGQIEQIEKSIARTLECDIPDLQISGALTLHRFREVAPEYGWDRCIIPLMRILNGEENNPSARLIAAMALHELRSSRGDFAISRNAQFTDNLRVKRYCVILTRTRLVEQGKLRSPQPSMNP